jgi:hypothetical protein
MIKLIAQAASFGRTTTRTTTTRPSARGGARVFGR